MSENEEQGILQRPISRRSLLKKAPEVALGVTTLVSGLGLGSPDQANAIVNEPNQSEELLEVVEDEPNPSDWGKIANSGHKGDLTRGIFFFAGPPNPNSPYPQLNPIIDWDSDQNIEKIFDQIKNANVNVINLSWWGDDGETEKWAPTINTDEVNQRVFKEAYDRNMMVAPVIEISPDFKFYEDFPDDTSNLEERIESLLSKYGNHKNWVQMYDRKGYKKHYIRLIETIHAGEVDSVKFAQTFDKVTDNIFKKTGFKIGFGIDPTPLPAYGSYNGPDETALADSDSILAIVPYNIFSDGETEGERLANANKILKRWISAGYPVIFPLITGFNDTGTDREHTQKFGNSTSWDGEMDKMYREFAHVLAGVTCDSYNTNSEGGSASPTRELGDVYYKYLQKMFNLPSLNPNKSPQLTVRGIAQNVAADK